MSWLRKRKRTAWDWAPYDGPPSHDVVGGRDVSAARDWLAERAAVESGRAMYEWFEARPGWPPEVHLATLARELPCVQARAACRLAAAARAELPAEESEELVRLLGLFVPEPQPRTVPYPHRISARTCWCVRPAHTRGADHCEWNEEHGWRPRPVTQDGA